MKPVALRPGRARLSTKPARLPDQNGPIAKTAEYREAYEDATARPVADRKDASLNKRFSRHPVRHDRRTAASAPSMQKLSAVIT
jgi:hypothetical protein